MLPAIETEGLVLRCDRFFHFEYIFIFPVIIADISHKVFDQMNAETTDIAVFEIICQLRLRSSEGIERFASIFDPKHQGAVNGGYDADLNKMVSAVLKGIGDNIGKDLFQYNEMGSQQYFRPQAHAFIPSLFCSSAVRCLIHSIKILYKSLINTVYPVWFPAF
jgi:hypothetical protein